MRFSGPVARMIIGLAFLLTLAGCSTLGISTNKALTADGMPRKKYLVGGGLHIEYVAPADGRLYWVEETTKKILAMKSVKADELTEFGTDSMATGAVKEKFGVGLKDANFGLYFIPDRE